MQDFIKINGIMSEGYGFSPKAVMRDARLTIEAKAIYAYMSSFAGAGLSSFPSVNLQIKELGISNKRYYKHRKLLEDLGYITIKMNRTINENGKSVRGKNLYILEQFPVEKKEDSEPKNDPKKEKKDKKSEDKIDGSEQCQNDTVEENLVKSTGSEQCRFATVQNVTAQNVTTNSNNLNSNRLNNNNNSSSSREDEDEELKKIMKICQLQKFKLKKEDAKALLLVYDFSKICKAIITASTVGGTNIKNYKGYLVATLNDLEKIKKVDINVQGKETKNKFNDFTQRKYDYDSLEKKLLGWDK